MNLDEALNQAGPNGRVVTIGDDGKTHIVTDQYINQMMAAGIRFTRFERQGKFVRAYPWCPPAPTTNISADLPKILLAALAIPIALFCGVFFIVIGVAVLLGGAASAGTSMHKHTHGGGAKRGIL